MNDQIQAGRTVEGLLRRARARLDRLVLVHGVASVLAAAALWLLVAYALDRALELPAPIRVFHLVLLAAIPAATAWRALLRPWKARPDDEGLAVLVERERPELSSLLVSAVQLARRPEGDPSLVAATVARAEAAARELDLSGLYDTRPARTRSLWLGAALFACGLAAWTDAEGVRIFVARMAGADVQWPRSTRLALELEGGTPVDPAVPLVRRVARGSDVSVVVRAEGETPDEVELVWSDGRTQTLAATGRGDFRAQLRAVAQDMEFWVRGGDDLDDQPRAKLFVLVPPDVASIAIAVEPPAYARLAPSLVRDGDAKVLQGSRVVVHVLAEPAGTRGAARLEPEGREIALLEGPFPVAEGETPVQGLSFSFVAESTTRFRFALKDANGLENPDPGLYGVDVLEDRAPRVETTSPSRADHDTTAQGWLALRARAEDDFGLSAIELRLEPLQGDALVLPLEHAELDPAVLAADRGAAELPRALWSVRERLSVASLFAAGACQPGAAADLLVVARDVREPQAKETRSTPVRVRVLSDDEFLRRLQDRLARAQTAANTLAELLRAKEAELRELGAALRSDDPESADAAGVNAAAAGVRRAQGDARSLARELCSTASALLYARIEDRADAALPLLDAEDEAARGVDRELWTRLDALAGAGQLGNGLAAKLVEIAALSTSISEAHAAAAAAAIKEAEEAVDAPRLATLVAGAADAERRALEGVEQLLSRLAEWDTLQSVLNLTRDILEAQKNLVERTRQAEQDK